MYCKFTGRIRSILEYAVLIVAKCIVNEGSGRKKADPELSINSSKVYCKLFRELLQDYTRTVLIVAKCIVNNRDFELFETSELVLIVAKCIVNLLEGLGAYWNMQY